MDSVGWNGDGMEWNGDSMEWKIHVEEIDFTNISCYATIIRNLIPRLSTLIVTFTSHKL